MLEFFNEYFDEKDLETMSYKEKDLLRSMFDDQMCSVRLVGIKLN